MEKEFFIGEDDYQDKMNHEVKSFIDSRVKTAKLKTRDGKNIAYYYAIHPESKGTIVLVHGFCEYFAKFHELSYYFYKEGFSFYFMELRGHGHSDHDIPENVCKVSTTSFFELRDDLKELLDRIILPKVGKENLYLYSHSMGGCISALFLEEYPDYFKKAVLSSPMMKISWNGLPMPVVKMLIWYKKRRREMDDYVPGAHDFNGKEEFETSSCMSRARYDKIMAYRKAYKGNQTYGGTYRWADASLKGMKSAQKNAKKIKTPIFLATAGSDNMVDNSGQDEFISHCAAIAKHKVYPGAKHELYNATQEIREEYFQDLFDYFEGETKC